MAGVFKEVISHDMNGLLNAFVWNGACFYAINVMNLQEKIYGAGDNDVIAALKSAAICGGIQEARNLAKRMGYSLELFH